MPQRHQYLTMNIKLLSRMMKMQPGKLSKPCTESLSLSEKEIARILGSQTFTGGLDSMETFVENSGFVS